MSYIDGYLIPVPVAHKEAYRQLAAKAAPIFLDYGALQVSENWSDDVPHGKDTDFYRAVKATSDEAIVFSWVLWPSKQVRDEVKDKVMADPRMKDMMAVPFDGKRLIYGGFEQLFEVTREPPATL